MLFLGLGAICFAGIHLGIAGTPLRDSAIAVLGEGAYRAVFSIVSLVTHCCWAATLTSSACPRFRCFGPRPTRSRRTCPCRKSNSNIRADLRNRQPNVNSTWHLDAVYLKIVKTLSRRLWLALVHMRLFGAGYQPMVERLLQATDI